MFKQQQRRLSLKSLPGHGICTCIAFPVDMNYLRLRETRKDSFANRDQVKAFS
ncbi:uncharacterized protein G2W53_010121 [Senna tora]|uniref:Uncharacterized protein n=1 Tax=Senna tora TaxID=362788 RepID=A0A835CDP6_9FABA|nr:uncharacterized protein G2W53_010121 [Senna tora]